MEIEQKKQEPGEKAFIWFLVYLTTVFIAFVFFTEPGVTIYEAGVSAVFLPLLAIGLFIAPFMVPFGWGNISALDIVMMIIVLSSLIAIINSIRYVFISRAQNRRQSNHFLFKPIPKTYSRVLKALLVFFSVFFLAFIFSFGV